MPQLRVITVLSALVASLMTAPAQADMFTWNPQAVKLNGTTVTADTLVLSDYAQISFTPASPATATFVDTGYLPIIGFRLNGQAVTPSGYLAPDGSGWGAYIRYTGTGTQTFSPQGVPVSATFQTLTYDIVGYNGLATFGFAPDHSATVGGTVSDVTTLETGTLITGSLAFLPGQFGPTINGQLQASIDEVEPEFDQAKPNALNVAFLHPAGEYGFTPLGTLQTLGGTGSSATIVSSKGGSGAALAEVTVPEPASAALLGMGLAGLLRRRRTAG